MKTFTIIFAMALITIVCAGHGSSYVSRKDDNHGHGGESHGHDDYKDYHHHPSYKYEYGVKDPKTGDHHSAWEHRDGDVVKGEYSLDEADGTKRVVKYTSDKKSGFNAVVEKIGHAKHPVHHDHEHHY